MSDLPRSEGDADGILKVIPKIKTPLQLSAFLATIVILFLTRTFAPDNVPAQITGGLIGVCIITFTLTFNFLHIFPAKDRSKLVVTLFSVFLAIVVILVALTGYYLLSSKSTVYSAVYETAKVELDRRAAALQSQLKSIQDRKVREQTVLRFGEWKELTEAESRITAQIRAIEGRKVRVQDTHTQAQAIVDEVKLLAQGGASGANAEIRREATDANEALARGDLSKAEGLFQTVSRAGAEQTARANFWLGRISELKAEFTEAAKYYKAANDMSPENLSYVEALAQIYEQLGDFVGSRGFYERLVSAFRGMPNRKSDLVIALKDAANVSRFVDDTQSARMYYAEAFEVARGFQGTDEIAFASVANDFGGFYVWIDEYKEGKKLYATSLEVYRRKGDKSAFGYAEVLNNLGYLHVLTGDYKSAETMLAEALELETATMGTNVQLFAVTTANLAQAYAEFGDFSRAEERYRRALDVAERILGKNHSRYGRLLGLYGEMLVQQGRFQEAAPVLATSHDVLVKSFGLEHRFVAISNLRKAEMLLGQGMASSALERIRSAEVAMERKMKSQPVLKARLARLKGRCSAQNRNHDEAVGYFTSALGDQRQVLGEKHPEVAKTLLEYGNVLSEKGEKSSAASVFEEARGIASTSLLPSHPVNLALKGKMQKG